MIARCNSAPLRARSPPARARRRRPRPKGRRNHSLYQAGIRLYSLVADGVLDHAEVQDGLLTAADAARLLDEEPLQTRRTLASAERTGLAHPAASPPATEHPALVQRVPPRRNQPDAVTTANAMPELPPAATAGRAGRPGHRQTMTPTTARRATWNSWG